MSTFPQTILVAIALGAVVACNESVTDPGSPLLAKKPSGPSDPTATLIFPTDETGLTLRSDGNATYADGVCGVAAKIYATTAASNSGDFTMQLNEVKGKTPCVRRLTVETPHGTFGISNFNNLPKLQNSTSDYIIPIGDEQPRRLIVGGVPGCDRLIFGYNNHPTLGDVAVGSDSLLVRRVAADRWEVRTNPEEGKKKAMCEDADLLIPMNVRFDIVSSYPLPTQ